MGKQEGQYVFCTYCGKFNFFLKNHIIDKSDMCDYFYIRSSPLMIDDNLYFKICNSEKSMWCVLANEKKKLGVVFLHQNQKVLIIGNYEKEKIKSHWKCKYCGLVFPYTTDCGCLYTRDVSVVVKGGV